MQAVDALEAAAAAFLARNSAPSIAEIVDGAESYALSLGLLRPGLHANAAQAFATAVWTALDAIVGASVDTEPVQVGEEPAPAAAPTEAEDR